jgi:hypothetical protein
MYSIDGVHPFRTSEKESWILGKKDVLQVGRGKCPAY